MSLLDGLIEVKKTKKDDDKDNVILPFWSAEEAPKFIERTDTEYASLSDPVQVLADRGIKNRLLENLLEYLPDGVIISGGFMMMVMMNEKKAKDIDLFFMNEKAFLDTMDLLKNPPKDAWSWSGYKMESQVDENDKVGISRCRFLKYTQDDRLPIQLVKLVWYEDASHVIDTFDFTVTQFSVDNKKLYMNPLAIWDLSNKKLVLHRMQFAASTIRRIIKYTSKGFYACPGSLATIATAIRDSKNSVIGDEKDFVYID